MPSEEPVQPASGGGCAGHVDKIEITGGKVTASAMGDKTNSAIQGAAIGSGYNGNSKEALPCGEISITGGEITADGNIGYGTGGNEYDGGSLRISGEAKLDVSGTISLKDPVGVAYTLQLTVYDLKLVGRQNIPGAAELKNQKKTTTCTVAGASAAIKLEYFAESALTGKQDVKVTLGADVYQTQVDFQEGRTDYTVQIGQPLCDTRLRLDIDWNWKTKCGKSPLSASGRRARAWQSGILCRRDDGMPRIEGLSLSPNVSSGRRAV